MGESDASAIGDQSPFSRRVFLRGTAAIGAATVAAGVSARSALGQVRVPRIALGAQPRDLPVRQHAWGEYLKIDDKGDPISPKFDRLIFFDVRGKPTADHVRLLEARLRSIERSFKWGPEGMLFTVSWGNSYFRDVLQVDSPIPKAAKRSSFESPVIDDFHMCIHLACNDQQRIAAVCQGLIRGKHVDGIGTLSLKPAFIWRDTRSGFAGVGLAAANQAVKGIPADKPVPKTSPLFMGFKSGLVKNQASEDRVTIADGKFAQGTTMQVSYMRETLDSWYSKLTQAQRIALMYSPQTTAAEVAAITTDAPKNNTSPKDFVAAIQKHGIVGHSQASATARQGGRPIIIRRDFNTVDDGYAGVHFVSVQRSIQDFIVTRNAMNASDAHALNKKITATRNNGINAFIDVKRRSNFIMPSRPDRSFPLWPGRTKALG